MLIKVVALKVVDHNITYVQKFVNMEWEKYLCAKSILGIGEILLELESWVEGLEKSRILNLLEIPHFGRG